MCPEVKVCALTFVQNVPLDHSSLLSAQAIFIHVSKWVSCPSAWCVVLNMYIYVWYCIILYLGYRWYYIVLHGIVRYDIISFVWYDNNIHSILYLAMRRWQSRRVKEVPDKKKKVGVVSNFLCITCPDGPLDSRCTRAEQATSCRQVEFKLARKIQIFQTTNDKRRRWPPMTWSMSPCHALVRVEQANRLPSRCCHISILAEHPWPEKLSKKWVTFSFAEGRFPNDCIHFLLCYVYVDHIRILHNRNTHLFLLRKWKLNLCQSDIEPWSFLLLRSLP